MRFRSPLPLSLLLAGAAAAALLPAGCAKRARMQRRSMVVVAQAEAVAVKDAAKPAPAPAKAAKAADEDPSWEVRGWGQSREEAEQDALRRAARRLKDYLRSQEPPVLWTPTPEYVRDHLQRGAAKRRKDLDQDLEAPGAPIKVQCWTIPVAVTAEQRVAIAGLDAEYRAEQRRLERAAVSRDRMVLLGRVLVGLVAALLALLAYLRVDEWTKGYYSRWLAAGAAGFLAAVGLGLWFWT
jgi:hypothetical protein